VIAKAAISANRRNAALPTANLRRIGELSFLSGVAGMRAARVDSRYGKWGNRTFLSDLTIMYPERFPDKCTRNGFQTNNTRIGYHTTRNAAADRVPAAGEGARQ
jgi:hypothetical protein